MQSMLNFFKSKEKVIRFYNKHPGVIKAYPVIESKDLKRPWMENVKKQHKNFMEVSTKSRRCPLSHIVSTAKCPGINTLFNTGYIVKNPVDVKIITNGDGISFNSSTVYDFDDNEFVTSHDPEQLSDLVAIPHQSIKTIIKITTSWRVECPNDIVFLVLPVNYSNETRFTACTGILDPQQSPEINVQLYWHVLNGVEVIKAGTPLVQYIPIPKFSNYKMINDEYNEYDEKRLRNIEYALMHSTQRNHNIIKKIIND